MGPLSTHFQPVLERPLARYTQPEGCRKWQHALPGSLYTCCTRTGPLCLQAVEVRIALAGALAQQYFGILTRPKTLRDSWLLHGLAGYLRDVWVRKALGRNEVRYRLVCKPLMC